MNLLFSVVSVETTPYYSVFLINNKTHVKTMLKQTSNSTDFVNKKKPVPCVSSTNDVIYDRISVIYVFLIMQIYEQARPSSPYL